MTSSTSPPGSPVAPNEPLSRDVIDVWQRRLSSARPFLKWAGGKQPFVARYGQYFPKFHGRYVEPFLGGGSVFFFLSRREERPFEALLGDVNRPLIETYRAIRDEPAGLAQDLQALVRAFWLSDDQAEFYYSIRSRFNGGRPRCSPADFLFLNRTCWNGLFRVNQRGDFNVPFGAPKGQGAFPSEDDLFAASAALMRTELRTTGWENTVSQARPGDLVFLDPPYVSDIRTSESKYKRTPFSDRDHRLLADEAQSLSDRGVMFVLTNSGESETERMYLDRGLSVVRVQVPRSINSKTELRKVADEIIVTPSWHRFGENL